MIVYLWTGSVCVYWYLRWNYFRLQQIIPASLYPTWNLTVLFNWNQFRLQTFAGFKYALKSIYFSVYSRRDIPTGCVPTIVTTTTNRMKTAKIRSGELFHFHLASPLLWTLSCEPSICIQTNVCIISPQWHPTAVTLIDCYQIDVHVLSLYTHRVLSRHGCIASIHIYTHSHHGRVRTWIVSIFI